MTYNRNPNQLSPAISFPERGRQEMDEVIADNPRREGPRQASENLGGQRVYRDSFLGGVASSRAGDLVERPTQVYEAQLAGQADGRSLLGSGQAVPAWDAVDPAERASFLQGQAYTEQQASLHGFPFEPRRGANRDVLGPTWGFSAGERPGNVIQVSIAPENGGRGRRNIADVTEQ